LFMGALGTKLALVPALNAGNHSLAPAKTESIPDASKTSSSNTNSHDSTNTTAPEVPQLSPSWSEYVKSLLKISWDGLSQKPPADPFLVFPHHLNQDKHDAEYVARSTVSLPYQETLDILSRPAYDVDAIWAFAHRHNLVPTPTPPNPYSDSKKQSDSRNKTNEAGSALPYSSVYPGWSFKESSAYKGTEVLRQLIGHLWAVQHWRTPPRPDAVGVAAHIHGQEYMITMASKPVVQALQIAVAELGPNTYQAFYYTQWLLTTRRAMLGTNAKLDYERESRAWTAAMFDSTISAAERSRRYMRLYERATGFTLPDTITTEELEAFATQRTEGLARAQT